MLKVMDRSSKVADKMLKVMDRSSKVTDKILKVMDRAPKVTDSIALSQAFLFKMHRYCWQNGCFLDKVE
ncbi:hypothetical protein [Lysinibacillus sp. ZYM-1]|uniref:hypothetical protein n=1 Tax=Lysinibacillus sp. ZYM-1 TaxID=1681184 RepID=UPI0006CE9580|nr:hypothetical protein [Lysinibacillus sp. ZYM-1]KPN88695.1 hypothetical protein AO843_09155 [Lysinibacillus sp. ZYM-1]